MPRNAKADKDTCHKSENANELARIGLYYIELCEAYRELAEAYRARRSFIAENGYCSPTIRQRCGEAEAKVEELEAACAAMRGVLDKARSLLDFLVVAGHYAGDKELLQECKNVLASDAGKPFLARMEAYKKVAEAALKHHGSVSIFCQSTTEDELMMALVELKEFELKELKATK